MVFTHELWQKQRGGEYRTLSTFHVVLCLLFLHTETSLILSA